MDWRKVLQEGLKVMLLLTLVVAIIWSIPELSNLDHPRP